MGVLRILLAIAVFLIHDGHLKTLGIPTLDGIAAVFCFFVVSGFYMEMVLTEKYNIARLGKDYFIKFWLARFWRLYPTYILICSSVVVIGISTSLIELPNIPHFNNTGFIANAKVILIWLFNLTMSFLNLPSSSDLLIGPSWSLGVEISFYAIAPFALRLKTFPLIALSIFSLALQIIPFGSHAPLFYGFHFFLLGALARRHTGALELIAPMAWKLQLPLLYSMVFIIVFTAAPYNIHIGPNWLHAHNSLESFIYPLIMVILVPLLHHRTKTNIIDTWIGQLSYPFYLVHEPVLKVFLNWTNDFKTLIILIFCITISILLMLLEVRFVDPYRSHFAR